MKQTAVEFIVSELTHKIGDGTYISINPDDDVTRLVEIAFKREREQIIHAHMDGASTKAEDKALGYYNLFFKHRK
jgi:hypothetical protein